MEVKDEPVVYRVNLRLSTAEGYEMRYHTIKDNYYEYETDAGAITGLTETAELYPGTVFLFVGNAAYPLHLVEGIEVNKQT